MNKYGDIMEKIIKENISTPLRLMILHYIVMNGATYPQELSEKLKISKGLPSQFLRLCTSLNLTNRTRIGHKVMYSLTSKGISILKRLCPEIFDLSFSALFENLPKRKFLTKYYPVDIIGFEIKRFVDNFGGVSYKFYDENGKELSTVFKPKKGKWWCVSCQSFDCKHIRYIKKYYEKVE